MSNVKHADAENVHEQLDADAKPGRRHRRRVSDVGFMTFFLRCFATPSNAQKRKQKKKESAPNLKKP
jgi:hypothetical protein